MIFGSMVKRLRHRPFTAVTRVRFPLESYGLVAQLVRAPPCHGGGRRFESDLGRAILYIFNIQYAFIPS